MLKAPYGAYIINGALQERECECFWLYFYDVWGVERDWEVKYITYLEFLQDNFQTLYE